MPKRSNLSPEEINEVLLNYNIGNIKTIDEFEKGEENINIFVETDKRRFVLRIYNQKRLKEQVEFELSVIEHLFSNGFPAPKIIKNNNGNLFGLYKQRFVVLFSYIEGDFISFSNLTKDQLVSIANNLSLMHKILLDFQPKGNKKKEEMFWFDMEHDIQEKIFPKILQNYHFKEIYEIVELLKQKLPAVEKELSFFNKDIKVGIVHNDFQDGNMKFKGNLVSGIFDFDDSCPGAIVSDVAITLNNFCFDEDKLNNDKYHLFISAYSQNIQLTEMEKRAIIPLIIHTNSFSIHNAIRLWSDDLNNKEYYLSVINWSFKKLKLLMEIK